MSGDPADRSAPGARPSTTSRGGRGRCPSRPGSQAQTRQDVLLAHWPVAARRARAPAPARARRRHLRRRGAGSGSPPAASTALRVRGLPPLPGLSSFPQLEVCTYVTVDGRPGLWLFSLELGKQLLVEAAEARRTGCPPTARGSRSRRRAGCVRGASATGSSFRARYDGRRRAVRRRQPGSLEHFLTERYALYTADGGRLYRAELHHAPWRLAAARRPRSRPRRSRRSRSRARRTRSTPPCRTCSSGRWRSSAEPAAPDGALLGRGCRRARRAQAHRSASPRTASASSPRRSTPGTDLVAALLTFLALGVAGRPADVSHQYGHGKAEHLAALAEASFLVARERPDRRPRDRAARRLVDRRHVHADLYVFATSRVVIAVDASRASVSWRSSQRHRQRRARLERAPLRERPRRLGRRARRAPARAGRPSGRRRGRGALRRRARPARGRAADPRSTSTS